MDNYDKEPVLLVPPRLTKSSYATLLSLDYVPRKWHLEGRHGSRTHKVEDRNKIGIPLLRSPDKIKSIASILKRRDDAFHAQDVPTTHKNEKKRKNANGDEDEDHNHGDGSADSSSSALRELLFTPGVELVYKTPVLSNKIPKDETFDATVHPERMPERFPSQLREFLQTARNHDDTIEDRNLTPTKRRKSSTCTVPGVASSDPAFTFCELFSGIGGFGVALEALGGKCVFASEIYAPSKRVYRANLDMNSLPDGKISGDIWDVDSKDIPFHDLLVGGFPCQPFSSLGDQPGLNDAKNVSGRKKGVEEDIQDGGGGRGQLFTQIVRVLGDVQPNAFLLENVPGLITTDDGNALRTIVSSLEAVGYHVSYEVCSSRGLTAQSRKRLYIVGIKHNGNGNGNGARDETKFQFPFMPDLQIRAVDVLHTREELQTSFASTGISPELVRHCGFEAQSQSPASMFRLTDSQMDQLRNRSKSWKPAKLAWDNTTCDTIDSHYGVTVGKVSNFNHSKQNSSTI